MNLDANPTPKELKNLFATADDTAGHHILWVDVNGDVYLNCLFGDVSPLGFEDKVDRVLKLRYETFTMGAGYVGPAAAEDEPMINRLFKSLVKEWADRPEAGKTEYIDEF